VTEVSAYLAARLAGVPAYVPGGSVPGAPSRKLSSNEAPLGPSPEIVAALRSAATEVNRYPEEAELLEGLAGHAGVAPDRLVLTNGSDELCSLVAQLFLGPGRPAVLGDPSYAIDVKVSVLAGAPVVRLVDGAHALPALALAATGAAVVWLPTPHNPTGVASPAAELRAFVATVPPSCLVVVDEAYRGFADAGYLVDAAGLVDEFPNVLVQRTLSKDWAIAGVRLGYGIGSPEVIGALRRARAPFSVSGLAVAAGLAGLGSTAWQEMSVARVREGRALLEAELKELGIDYLPSQANFVLVRIPHYRIAERLAAVGISVRPGENLGMPGWVRITVGWAPVMAELRKLLRAEFAAESSETKRSADV
jgi:histidinol-phosphate aminotransferase